MCGGLSEWGRRHFTYWADINQATDGNSIGYSRSQPGSQFRLCQWAFAQVCISSKNCSVSVGASVVLLTHYVVSVHSASGYTLV